MNRASLNDHELAAQARQGDRAAFAEIYNRHYRAVYTYIFYRVSDGMLAEDLTADVFLRLVDKIHTFKPQKRPILAWLYTIARNLIIDYHRRHSLTTLVALNDNLETSADNPVAQAETHLRQAELAAVLTQLTEDQQQVILLKFVEGYSNARVAAALDKTEGAVKSLQHRALAALHRALPPEKGA